MKKKKDFIAVLPEKIDSKNTCVLVCMYDKVTGQYSTPMAFDSVAVAKRWFGFYVNKAELMAEPSDFELYYIADFCSDTGKISCFDKMDFLMKGFAVNE